MAEPDRRGFGTRLIERSLAAEAAGRAEITFAAEGPRRLVAEVIEEQAPSI